MEVSFKFACRARLRRRPGSHRSRLPQLESRNLPGFLAPLSFDAGPNPYWIRARGLRSAENGGMTQ
jgi:hypothetical protein